MPDKGQRLSDFGSAFFHLNMGNGKMPLKPFPKQSPYVVFFLLYDFFGMRVVFFVFYSWCCM